MELNILTSVLCTKEYDSQGSKVFVRLLSIINVYLREKQQFCPLYSYQKFPRSGHKPLNGYFDKEIIQKCERVVRVR